MSLFQIATANFDVYQMTKTNSLNKAVSDGWEVSDEWGIFPTEQDCNDVMNYPIDYWLDRDDVGKKVGVRCVSPADCVSGKPERIQILEMAFNHKSPRYHWGKEQHACRKITTKHADRMVLTTAIYNNTNYEIYGLDGSIAGTCILFPGHDFQCSRPLNVISGVRKFRCLTEFTAQQIIDSRKKSVALEHMAGNQIEE